MRKLLLINPPVSRYDTAEIAPPLGLLVLAAQARAAGIDAKILDLNLPSFRRLGDDPNRFYGFILEHELLQRADEVGITSMGVNSHVALQLGSTIIERLGIPVNFGGAHLAAIGGLVTELLPEAKVWSNAARKVLPNDDWRHWDQVWLSKSRIHELFSCVDLEPYFAVNKRRLANLETGRGCRYNCAFCYSPGTHGGWQTCTPESIPESFEALDELGISHTFLVDDNLTNDVEWLASVCDHLGTNRKITWNGYATVRDLKPKILPRLVEAGCTNLYLGVDAVAPSLQREWRKRFFSDISQVANLVQSACAEGLGITVAFILTATAGETEENLAAIDAALLLRRRGAEVRFSLLTPYPGTAVFSGSLKYSEARTAMLMDLPRVVVENPLARVHPAEFPWHAAPTSARAWDETVLAMNALQTAFLDASFDCLPDTGAELWNRCARAAQMIALEPSVHKVELRDKLQSHLWTPLEVW